MNKICARCGAESRNEARFCDGCGASNFKLVSASVRSALVVPCPSCRHLNRPGTNLCVKCGTTLLGASALTAPAPLAAAAAPSPEPDIERQVGEVVELPDWALEPAAPPRSAIWIATPMIAFIVVAAVAWVVLGRDAPEFDPDATTPLLAEPAAADKPTLPAAAAPSAGPTDDQAATPSPAPAPSVARTPTPVAAISRVTPEEAALESKRLAQDKREREARARAALEQQRAAEQRGVQREAEAAQQRAAAPQQVAPPTAAPAPVAAKAARPQTVREICSGRNFVSEQLCLSSECRNPSHASDPICVRRKELEDSSNRRVEQ